MNAQPRPLRVEGTEDSPWVANGRLRSILGREIESDATSRIVERWIGDHGDEWSVTWIDSGLSTPVMAWKTTAILHVLWTRDLQGMWVEIDDQEDEGGTSTRIPITPGDTLTVPPGTPFSLGPEGVLLVVAQSPGEPKEQTAPDTDRPVPSPMHGLQVFDGFNRRTFCAVTENLVLERWKLTQPLALDLAPDRWHLLVNLVQPVALAWPGGSQITSRARSWCLPAGLRGLTVVPDNLGYILLAYRPDLDRDVIAPLRAAGYDASTIASIGVPRTLLGT